MNLIRCLLLATLCQVVAFAEVRADDPAPRKKCDPSLARIACEIPISLDPNDCRDVWEQVGLPEWHGDSSTSDLPAEDQYSTICHRGYVAQHNNDTKIPDWVLENLGKKVSEKKNKRPKTGFRQDPCSRARAHAVDDDYTHSQYARGHQAASDDFAALQPWMCDTFFFSNAVPQEGGKFNSSVWRELEERIQTIAKSREQIYVITGPIYQAGDGEDIVIPASRNSCGNEIRLPALERKAICGGTRVAPRVSEPKTDCGPDGVAIPAGLFKIVFDARNNRVNGYIMPNVEHPVEGREDLSTDAYIDSWRVSLVRIEDLTEYEFLSGLDVNRLNDGGRSRRRAKAKCPATIHR